MSCHKVVIPSGVRSGQAAVVADALLVSVLDDHFADFTTFSVKKCGHLALHSISSLLYS